MTREHLFFIPFVFLLGFVAGTLVTRARLGTATQPAPRVGVRALVVPLVAFVVLFVATHVLSAHGGARAVEDALGGRPLFDQRPSFSAAEVYERLAAFGPDGRAAYARMTFTTDVIFPLALFAFLVQLLRFAAERGRSSTVPRAFVLALPTAWLLSDFAENAVIHRLLTTYPARHDTLAAALGSLTYLKFTLLLASVALAAAVGLPRPSGEKSAPGAFRS